MWAKYSPVFTIEIIFIIIIVIIIVVVFIAVVFFFSSSVVVVVVIQCQVDTFALRSFTLALSDDF